MKSNINIKEDQFYGLQEVLSLLYLIFAILKYLFITVLSIFYLFTLIFMRIIRLLSIFHTEGVRSRYSRIEFHRKTIFLFQVQVHRLEIYGQSCFRCGESVY